MARVGRRPAPSKQGRKAILVCAEGDTERDYFSFESRPPRLNAHDSALRVGEFLPGYLVESKRLSSSQIDALLDRTDVALENARQWRLQCESPDNFTDVDLLVQTILDVWSR